MTDQAVIDQYIQDGIAMGLATGWDSTEDEIRRISDAHRVANGVAPAEYFIMYESPFAACKEHSYLSASNALFGSFDAHWLMAWKYTEQVKGDKSLTARVENLFELGKRIGWFWMSSNATIVTKRPEHIRTITKPGNNGKPTIVLHSYDQKAIEYSDGTGIYAINGIQIPKEFAWVVTTPADQLDPKKVMDIRNTEIRTEAIKKVGVERLYSMLDKKVLDTASFTTGHHFEETELLDDNTGLPYIGYVLVEGPPQVNHTSHYELVEFDFGGHRRVYLQGNCPSSGDAFTEAVPPTIKTCAEALSWREFGTHTIKYVPPAVRT